MGVLPPTQKKRLEVSGRDVCSCLTSCRKSEKGIETVLRLKLSAKAPNFFQLPNLSMSTSIVCGVFGRGVTERSGTKWHSFPQRERPLRGKRHVAQKRLTKLGRSGDWSCSVKNETSHLTKLTGHPPIFWGAQRDGREFVAKSGLSRGS